MAHYSVRTHYKYNIARAHFREIVLLAARISLVSKNKGADHGGVAAAPVILADPVDVHNTVGCRAGNLVFMGSWRIVRPPDRAVGPILFQLAQKLQHIFLGDRLPVGQKAVPSAGRYAWTCAGLGTVDQHRHFASGDGIGVGGGFVDPAQTGGIGAGGIVVPDTALSIRNTADPQDNGAGCRRIYRI